MFIRWFFKHIVVILIISAALLGYLKFDDLAHWFPSSVGRQEQSAKVGTADEHDVAVISGVAEDRKVPEAISQRHINQSDAKSKPAKASDSREGAEISQPEMESVFQRVTEAEEPLPESDVGSTTAADSRDEVVADYTPASAEVSRQAHKAQITPSAQADISSAITQANQVAGSEDPDVLSSDSVILNTSQGELTEGVSGTQLKPPKQLASKQITSVTDMAVGKTMMAPELSLMRGSGQKGSETRRMNEIGDMTRREAAPSRRQQLPPTDTAADSKSLPTPLVEWIPPSAKLKEDTEEAAGTPAAQRQTVQEIWVDARSAFWNRDLAVAELKYQTLSVKLPDNPDVMGELGNVFYVQGKHKQTLAAYYRAAELLIEKGRSNRVNIILDLIYKLEPEKANILRARMARIHDDTGG